MKVAVCMCLFRRYGNLPLIIRGLEDQTVRDFTFWVWDNTAGLRSKIQSMLDSSKLHGCVMGVGENKGSIARFNLAYLSGSDLTIFIDDDQVPHKDLVEESIKWHKEFPEAILAHHTRIFTQEQYWNGSFPGEPGQEVDYCGTGGMVLPTKIIRAINLAKFPPKFKSIEDLLLCAFAQMEIGTKCYAKTSQIFHLYDNKDQYTTLGDLKDECFAYLRGLGWRLLKD